MSLSPSKAGPAPGEPIGHYFRVVPRPGVNWQGVSSAAAVEDLFLEGAPVTITFVVSLKERGDVRSPPLLGWYRKSSEARSHVLPRHSGDPPPTCAHRYWR